MFLRILRPLVIGSTSLVVLAAISLPALADDAALKAGISRILQDGWNVTPTARAAADAQYNELQSLGRGDSRLLTASALVLMQQRRYDEAAKRLDELLAQDDDNLFALRAKCWLATTLKSYGSAIVVAEKLRAALPAENTQDQAGNAVAEEQLAFLGRICGFLAGPVADQVDQTSRKQLERTILAGLSAERKQVFEEARDGVSQKFFELTDTKLDTEKQNAEERKLEAEQKLQDVEATRKEIDERVKDLEERGAKLQNELNSELADVAKRDAPLAAEFNRLQARADLIGRNVSSYQIQIDGLQLRLTRERDPNIRAAIQRDIDNLAFQANRVANELNGVERQGANVASQRAALAARAQQAQNSFGGQIDRINKELVSLGKKEKRADAEEKKAKKPVSGSSTKTVAISSQVTALSTYDKLPLEQLRQRLLAELK